MKLPRSAKPWAAAGLVSTPERALLELLSDVGKGQELEEARHLVESARTLRQPVLEELLAPHHQVRRAARPEAADGHEAYVRKVQLLLDIAPAVFETPVFAIRGGTALNLLAQDMSRLPAPKSARHPRRLCRRPVIGFPESLPSPRS